MGKVGEASDDTLLGEVTVHVRWSPGERRPPVCADVASGYDSRPRRGSHLNAMQWKTFIEANVPQMNCLSAGSSRSARPGSRTPAASPNSLMPM